MPLKSIKPNQIQFWLNIIRRFLYFIIVQSTGTVEYTDCTYAEE